MAFHSFQLLLAKRILRDKGNRFSRPIVSLSVFGVSLGVVIMLIALGITSGYKREIREKVISLGSHIQITHYDQNRSFEQVPFEKKQAFVEELQHHKDVVSVQNFALKVGIIKASDQVEGIVLKGVDETFNQRKFSQNILAGDTLTLGDSMLFREIIISKHIADKLCLKVGDKVPTYFVQDPPRSRSFVVKGVYQTGLPEYDNMYAIVDLRHVQKLNDWSENKVSGMEVVIRDYDKIENMGDYVHHHVPYTLKAETIHQIYPEIFEWIALFDTNVLVLLIITTCVCLVTMMSIFFIIILEQTHTIGVLKSLGMNTKQVANTFILVAGHILLKGLLIGNIVAIGLGVLQQHFHIVKLNPETYYVDYVPLHFNVLMVLALNVAVFILCLLVLVVPAWLVGKKINPIQAVRWE